MKQKKTAKKLPRSKEQHSSEKQVSLLDVSFILNMVLIAALTYTLINDETEFYKGISKSYELIAKESIKQSQDVLKTNYDLIGELKLCTDKLPKVEAVAVDL